MRTKLFVLGLALSAVFCQSAQAQTSTSGYWSDPNTWGGQVPQAGGVIYIPAGKTVTLDVSPPALRSIQVDGSLVFQRKTLNLSADWLMVNGSLSIGTSSSPFQQKATITLTGSNTSENIDGMGTKLLGVMGTGKLALYGSNRVSWVRLNASANAGATSLTLDKSVDWKVGERIVVGTTNFNPYESEEVQIATVSGTSITLTTPLKYSHYGQQQTFNGKTLDERAEVGLLTRSIVIQGDSGSETNSFGGHVMIEGAGVATVKNVEFYRMGQLGIKGRYPFHLHQLGDSPSSFLKNSSIHHSFNRCVAIHDTNKATIDSNVAFDALGHCFFIENGTEQYNVLSNNLGLLTRLSSVPLISSDSTPSTYWISNPNNTLTGNVAGGSEAIGYWYDIPSTATTFSGQTFTPSTMPLGLFQNNVSHSNYAGWQSAVGLYVSGYNLNGTFDSFTSYRNAQKGVWFDAGGQQTLTNAKFADNLVGFFGINATLKNSLVVGISANPDDLAVFTELGWNGGTVLGLQEYDGWLHVEDTTFVNLLGSGDPNIQNKAAYGGVFGVNQAHGQTSGQSYLKGTTLVNARPTYFPPVNDQSTDIRTYEIEDKDGTTSGYGQPGFLVLEKNLLSTSSCIAQPDGNAYWCPLRYGKLNFNPLVYSGTWDNMQLTRDDNVVGKVSAWVAPNGIPLSWSNVMVGRTYIAAPTATVKSVQASLEGLSTDWTVMGFPLSSTSVSVADSKGKTVTRATSLDALKASSTQGYYLDTTNRRFYMKLFGISDGSYLTITGS